LSPTLHYPALSLQRRCIASSGTSREIVLTERTSTTKMPSVAFSSVPSSIREWPDAGMDSAEPDDRM
jgi:hypothetical protein